MTKPTAQSGIWAVVAPFLTLQFLKFLFVGGVAALLHWVARFFLTPLIGYVPSLLLAYVFGMLVAYILNAVFVFSKASNKRREQILYFVIVNLMMAPIVIAVSWLLSEIAFPAIGVDVFPREIAHAIGVASPVVLSFLLHKFFTFKGA